MFFKVLKKIFLFNALIFISNLPEGPSINDVILFGQKSTPSPLVTFRHKYLTPHQL